MSAVAAIDVAIHLAAARDFAAFEVPADAILDVYASVNCARTKLT
jgi:hypothetical protein